MDWNTASQIATVIGELGAAAALVSGFVLYRMARRDDYVAEFKRLVATNRGRCHRLDELLTGELINELVRAVVFSQELDGPIEDLYTKHFQDSAQPSEKDLESYMQKDFPAIVVSVRSTLADSFESLLIEIDSDLARYQTEFPALYRVFSAVTGFLRSVERNIKKSAQSDKVWENLIPQMKVVEKVLPDVEHFKDRLALIILGLIQNVVAKKGQKDVSNALELLDLVVDTYLAKPARSLMSWASREQNLKYLPLKDTKTNTEDLRQAENALKRMLNQDDILRYRELVTKLEATPS